VPKGVLKEHEILVTQCPVEKIQEKRTNFPDRTDSWPGSVSKN